MTRVLHVTPWMRRGGGIENMLMNIYRQIDRSQVQFDFLLDREYEGDFCDEIRALGGRVFFVSPRRKGLAKNKKELRLFFAQHREYRIVHQHVSSLSYITPLAMAKQAGVPVRIVHSHNTSQSGFMHRLLHRVNQLRITGVATDYFACSQAAAEWLYPRSILGRHQSVLVNNAIDADRFRYRAETRNLLRDSLGIQSDEILLGHVGSFANQKNHALLVEIFAAYLASGANAKLLLVGEGPLLEQVKARVKELGLEERVIFAGIRKDVHDLMQAMDIFVMPSLHEGLPLTVVEAQAAGLPCVLSTAITKEVALLDTVQWRSLTDSLDQWVGALRAAPGAQDRQDTFDIISAKGYEAKSAAQRLAQFYQSKVI